MSILKPSSGADRRPWPPGPRPGAHRPKKTKFCRSPKQNPSSLRQAPAATAPPPAASWTPPGPVSRPSAPARLLAAARCSARRVLLAARLHLLLSSCPRSAACSCPAVPGAPRRRLLLPGCPPAPAWLLRPWHLARPVGGRPAPASRWPLRCGRAARLAPRRSALARPPATRPRAVARAVRRRGCSSELTSHHHRVCESPISQHLASSPGHAPSARQNEEEA